MFERFFNRNNACNSTRGFSAEGTQRVCACCAAQSENMNSLLSLDTALAVSIFVALSLALIIIRLISVLVLICVLVCIITVLSVVIILVRTPQRPRLVSAS